jgi:two-component system chemotaxis response regulator CheB
MPGRDIVVIGASAGGVEALKTLVRYLPGDLPAAVFVVLHFPANGTSALPTILNRSGPLPAAHPRDGDAIERGTISIAPPDHHLLVHRGYIRLTRGPRENRHRPAVDPLFRSAARAYGNRVIGVVLSGTLDDGTAGLLAIKARQGLAIAQNPDEALFPGMPLSAVRNVAVDHVVPLSEMGKVIGRLVHDVVDEGGPSVSEEMDQEVAYAELDLDTIESDGVTSMPSTFGCPECGGVLWELRDGALVRFRCRVGHAYTANSLLAEQSDALEDALWAALRGLEEKASLLNRLAARAGEHAQAHAAKRFSEQEDDCRRRAAVIRQVLLGGDAPPPPEEEAEFWSERTTAVRSVG